MTQEKYTIKSEADADALIKKGTNIVNKVTSEGIHNQIRDLSKQCQVGQTPEDKKLGGIIEKIHEGLKRWPDQTPFYQSILKSYPKIYEKDKELKEKGLI